MGKKTKKTKWRTLEISLPVSGKNYHENGANLQLDDGWRASYSYDKYRRSASAAGYDKIVKTSACDAKNSSVEQNHAKAQIEDEYTKITTPRQDVLFKKGYLTRRKTWRRTCDENTSIAAAAAAAAADSFASNETAVNLGDIQAQADYASNGDEEFCDYASMTTDGGSRLPSLSPVQPQSHSQQLLCATSQPYIDASAAAAALYYGGGYEIYDPYTGSVTALVVGATPTASSAAASAAASCQPLLTSMPCRPVPLHSLQWFNPVPSSSEWCCDANANANAASSYAAIVDDADADAGDGDSVAKASHSGDSTNANTSASESSSVAENTTPTTGAGAGAGGGGDVAAYPPHPAHPSQSYIYPSYVFGTAAVYSIEDDGANVRYCSPESSIFNGNESATTKRKKRRKRRRRFGETEDDSESGVEENLDEYVVFSCENQVVDYAYNEYAYKNNDELAATVHVQNQSNYSPFGSQNALHGHGHGHDGRHSTSLPHASVNAPPFVPANCGDGGGDLSCCRSNHKYVDKVENESAAAAAAAASINAVDSKVRRETFVDGENQSPTDSPSSSNNSDSGISSPGIEDCPSIGGQDQDFRKSVQTDRSKTSFNNNLATSPVMRSGDGDKTASGAVAVAAAAAVIPAAMAAAAAGDAPAATLSSDDKAKICDSSCASAEAKCGLDDKPLKKIRAKNTSSRVKRCHSKNEERYRRRSVSERDLGATDRRADDESVDCAPSVAVCDQQPPSATENRWKKSTIIETCANEERSSSNEKNRRHESENENGRVIDTISDVVDGNEPQQAENDASHLHADSFENQIANCDQTDACAVDPNDAALSASSLSRRVPQQSTCWPKANVDADADADADASERAAPQDGGVNEDSQSRYSSERVALAARILVDEIVQQAESQIRMSTTKCDKLQLPLTQAVTNWLNERGGLPAVAVDGFEIKHHRRLFSTQPPSDESLNGETTVSRRSQSKETVDKSKKSSSNCVIC